jgi:hypothetical protein
MVLLIENKMQPQSDYNRPPWTATDTLHIAINPEWALSQ